MMLTGKRIAGIDFGFKRVGVAVCDELHISANPKAVLEYNSNGFWDELANIFERERVSAAVVGVPYRNDDINKEIIDHIHYFAEKVKHKFNIPVFFQDEAYSSKKAVEIMLEIGKNKKHRINRGNTDLIASAVILNEFLLTLNDR
jgi:putative holliday junction resolvase